MSLDVPFGETISRDEYETHIVAPLREALQRNDLHTTTRALVVTYDLPLHVAAPVLTAEEKRTLSDARSRIRTARQFLEHLEKSVQQIAVSDPPPSTVTPHHQSDSVTEGQQVAREFGHVGRGIQAAIRRIRSQPAHAEFSRWEQELTRTYLKIEKAVLRRSSAARFT